MSLQILTDDIAKPWLDIRCNDAVIDNDLSIANDLTITNDLTVSGVLNPTAGPTVGANPSRMAFIPVGDLEVATDNNLDPSVAVYCSAVVNTAAANRTGSMANGTVVGQLKRILYENSDAGARAYILTSAAGNNFITNAADERNTLTLSGLAAAGHAEALLMWDGTYWRLVGGIKAALSSVP